MTAKEETFAQKLNKARLALTQEEIKIAAMTLQNLNGLETITLLRGTRGWPLEKATAAMRAGREANAIIATVRTEAPHPPKK